MTLFIPSPGELFLIGVLIFALFGVKYAYVKIQESRYQYHVEQNKKKQE